MVKYLLNFLFIFLILSSFSFAKSGDGKLQAEFGPDLTKAPFFLRFSFYKKYNEDWKNSSYLERETFLAKYEADLKADQAQAKTEARAEAQKEKELSLKKRDEERKKQDKLKAQLAEEKAEQREEQERQKEFNAGLAEQKKELDQMMRQTAQGN